MSEQDDPRSSELLVREELATALGQLARAVQQQVGTEDTLQQVVRGAIALIPGVDEASISVVAARRTVQNWAASSDLPRVVDALQNETRQGPCLDAAFQHEVVEVPDLATEPRWPLFTARAVAAGAHSMLSLRLFVSGGDLGALNLFSRSPNAFTEESRRTGLPFAAHAAVALAQVLQLDRLMAAVDSRDVIGTAKGILMERHRLSAEQAFSLLTTVSQQRNVKLRDIAHELVYSGLLTGPHGSV